MVGKMRRLQEEPSMGTFVADGEIIFGSPMYIRGTESDPC